MAARRILTRHIQPLRPGAREEARVKIINQHLGLPVISLDTSERAGDLVRFITDQVSGRIVAVAVSRKWYQEPHGVPFEECRAFGQNVVLITRLDALRPLSEMEEVGIHLEAANDARQRTAITEGGRLLGSVTDEAFDEATGEVTGYRLDVLADTGTSRTVYIPHSAFVTSSAAVAILREDVLDHAVEALEYLEAGAPPAPESPAQPDESEPDTEPDTEPEPVAPAEASEPEAVAPVEPEPAPPAPEPEAPAAVEAVEEAPAPAPAAPEGDEIVVEPEEFAPTTPDYEPEAPEAPGADAMGGHNRVMMALSLGRIAGATLHDRDGNLLVEKGGKITMEIARAAARADALYDLWTAAQEPKDE